MDILFLLVLFAINCLPIVIWSYVYTHIWGDKLYKSVFFLWGIMGGISLSILLYFQDILNYLGIFSDKFFWLFLWDISFSSFIFAVLFLVSYIFFISVVFSLFSSNKKSIFTHLFLFCIVSFFLLLSYIGGIYILPDIDFTSLPYIQVFGWYTLSSIYLVILYYLIVAFFEECGKYISFLSLYKRIPSHYVFIWMIFIALWFSFTENFYYTYQVYTKGGSIWELLQIGTYRGIFSTTVHVLGSIFILSILWDIGNIFLKKKKYFFISIMGMIGWVYLHTIFNIGMTLGLLFVSVLYFLWGYLFISYILYYHHKNSLIKELG